MGCAPTNRARNLTPVGKKEETVKKNSNLFLKNESKVIA